jgi:microcystin-dependent protein
MSDQYLAEIRLFPFNYAPLGWAFCNGQKMSVSQSHALFSLIGTYYGGDGFSYFLLPDLQDLAPVNQGIGIGLSPYEVGQTGGSPTVTLTAAQNGIHNHSLAADKGTATASGPAGGVYMKGHYSVEGGTPGAVAAYSAQAPDSSMSANAILPAGGTGAHNNMMPYLTLNFCIALEGEFPERG